jgi:hypothetical protein
MCHSVQHSIDLCTSLDAFMNLQKLLLLTPSSLSEFQSNYQCNAGVHCESGWEISAFQKQFVE